MTCISIKQFAGINPDLSSRALSRVNAQIAHNCLLTDGTLRPMPQWTLFSVLPVGTYTEGNYLYEDSRDGRTLAAIDFRDGVYLTGKPFAKDILVGVDKSVNPVVFGVTSNIYEADNADSSAKQIAGLPTPKFGTHITSSNVSYISQNHSVKPVNRILGVTFCRQTTNGFEESTIAVIPNQNPFGVMYEGDIVSVTLALNTALLATARVTHIRLYRTISGLDTGEQVNNELDTDWHLIDTIAVVPNITYNDGGAVTTDPMDLYLASHFYPPMFHAEHFGLTESGWFYMVSSDGRGAVSERYLHHAWPTEHQFTIFEEVTDVVAHLDTLFIGTNRKPYLAAVGPGEGEQGAQVSAIPFDERMPCLPRTMVPAPGGVIYASDKGLVALSKSGQKVITAGITNPGDRLYRDAEGNTATIGKTTLGAFWNGLYFGFIAEQDTDEPPEDGIIVEGDLPDGPIYDVAMQLVLLASTDGGRICESTDRGLTWISTYIGPNIATAWRGITKGLGLYVVVGNDPNPIIWTSPDKITWTPRAHPIPGVAFTDVEFGNVGGVDMFIATAHFGGGVFGRIIHSLDGITWTNSASISGGGAPQFNKCMIHDGVAWVIAENSGNVYKSVDGSNWTHVGVGSSLFGICYGDNEFMVVGDGGQTYTSPDGIIWTFRSIGPGSYSFMDVTYDPTTNRYVAASFGDPGSEGVYYSEDNGDTWNNIAPVVDFYVVISIDGVTIAGASASNIFYSDDGFATWIDTDALDSNVVNDFYGALEPIG